MSGFTYSIQFNSVGSAGLSRVLAVLDQLDNQVDDLNVSVNRMGSNFNRAGRLGQTSFVGISAGLSGLIAQLGVAAGLTQSVRNAMQMEGIEASIGFATGGVEQGAAAMQFLDDITDRLGTNFMESAQAYKGLAASVQGTPLAGAVNEIFTAVSEGATVMRLTDADFQGVTLAISQMASKGKVSSEELRQQLGERLPGAMGIASRAMGMNQQDFTKLLESGNLYAEDFLPKFAAEMRRTYADGIPAAVNSSQAQFNRFQKSITELSIVVGEKLLPPFLKFLNEVAIPAATWIGNNIDVVAALGGAILGAAGTFKVITAATWLFNGALLANPIGLVIGALWAVGAAVVWAWNRFEKFRGFLYGFFAYLKESVKLFFEIFVEPLKNIGKILVGIFTLDKSLILEGIKGNMEVFENSVMKAGQRLGTAFNDGYAKGVDNFRAGNPAAGDPIARQFGGTTGGGTTPADTKIKAGLNGIADGGKQMKSITINVNKLVEQLILKAERVDQGISKVRDAVQREFLQVLNTANQIQ